jgi:hypothetical protein
MEPSSFVIIFDVIEKALPLVAIILIVIGLIIIAIRNMRK